MPSLNLMPTKAHDFEIIVHNSPLSFESKAGEILYGHHAKVVGESNNCCR